MASLVVLDAGPLGALLDRDDQFHDWAVARTAELELHTQLITCGAVIAEAFFLERRVSGGVSGLLALLEQGAVRLDFDLRENQATVFALMRKYADVPMSVADACLVRMSELHDRSRVFTLDADFKLDRRHSRHSIPLIIPAP